jgi:hypothetical protein
MKVYFMEKLGETKINFISVEHSQRAKVWAARPNAKEISRKEYEDIKYEYSKINKETAK